MYDNIFDIFDENYFDIADESIADIFGRMRDKKTKPNTSRTHYSEKIDSDNTNNGEDDDWYDDAISNPEFKKYRYDMDKYNDLIDDLYSKYNTKDPEYNRLFTEYQNKQIEIERKLIRDVYAKYKTKGITMSDAKYFAHNYLDS